MGKTLVVEVITQTRRRSARDLSIRKQGSKNDAKKQKNWGDRDSYSSRLGEILHMQTRIIVHS
jgi:hypothetical protein